VEGAADDHSQAATPTFARAMTEGDAAAASAGHTTTADASRAGGSRRRPGWQTLYWVLVVVSYSCLAFALATVAPDLFKLPIDENALPIWRNALTMTGLLSGLWAWLLARRLR
jgi:hypothetical protein